MEHAFASSSRADVTVATTALLALCCAAARPLGPQEALPPAAGQRRAAASGYDDAAARAGKWLPFAGAGGIVPHNHLPAALWAYKPMPWVGFGAGAHGGSGAFEGGGEEEEELVRERSYERGESDTTRQEQLAMWASLLNPKGKRRREAIGWLPAPGIGDEEPAKTTEGTTEVDDPATSGVQTKSGFDWGNNGNDELEMNVLKWDHALLKIIVLD